MPQEGFFGGSICDSEVVAATESADRGARPMILKNAATSLFQKTSSTPIMLAIPEVTVITWSGPAYTANNVICMTTPLHGKLYWTVMLCDPVAQLPVAVSDAVMVADPDATNVAVLPEKVTTDVLLELQVVELVTSTLFNVAVNTAVVLTLNVVPEGTELITSVCEVPPVVLPVIDPWTPAKVAVIVTLEAGPTAVTIPVVPTVAHELELDQLAWLVTIFVPLLKVAVAVSCCGEFTATKSVVTPPACVTAIEFGWLTKNPVQPLLTISRARAAATEICDSFRSELGISALTTSTTPRRSS